MTKHSKNKDLHRGVKRHMDNLSPINLIETNDLANLFGVTTRSVRRYKASQSAPAPGLIHLAELYVNGRIMPNDWPQWMKFVDGELIADKRGLKPDQINNLSWITDQWITTTRITKRLSDRVRELLPLLPDDIAKELAEAVGIIQQVTETPKVPKIRPR